LSFILFNTVAATATCPVNDSPAASELTKRAKRFMSDVENVPARETRLAPPAPTTPGIISLSPASI